MKVIISSLVCVISFFSCGAENKTAELNKVTDENMITKESKTSEKEKAIENFDCSSLFKSGNYSHTCFIDSKLPKFINRGCIFDFKTKGDKHYESLKVQFEGKKSTILAEMHLNLNKNKPKGTITKVLDLGSEAFFDVYTKGMKSATTNNKDLHVRYKNITFILFAEHTKTEETPCFYSDEELIEFANLIIQNL